MRILLRQEHNSEKIYSNMFYSFFPQNLIVQIATLFKHGLWSLEIHLTSIWKMSQNLKKRKHGVLQFWKDFRIIRQVPIVSIAPRPPHHPILGEEGRLAGLTPHCILSKKEGQQRVGLWNEAKELPRWPPLNLWEHQLSLTQLLTCALNWMLFMYLNNDWNCFLADQHISFLNEELWRTLLFATVTVDEAKGGLWCRASRKWHVEPKPEFDR